jgi:hypothetical protein
MLSPGEGRIRVVVKRRWLKALDEPLFDPRVASGPWVATCHRSEDPHIEKPMTTHVPLIVPGLV